MCLGGPPLLKQIFRPNHSKFFDLSGQQENFGSVHISHNHVRGWDGGQGSLDYPPGGKQQNDYELHEYFYTLIFKVVRKSSSFNKPQVDTIFKKKKFHLYWPKS